MKTDGHPNPNITLNVMIVWQQSDGSNIQIFKSEYRGDTWIHPTGLTDNISPDGQDATSPEVAMGNNGDAIVVWSQDSGNGDQIFKSEYRGGTWNHPNSFLDYISVPPNFPIPTNLGFAYNPKVAMHDNGQATIVWEQSDGNNWQIFKSEK